MALSGSLVDFPLEGVLRLVESTRKSGMLEVAAEGEIGVLEITEGRLTGARFGDDVGDSALGVIFGMADGTFSFRPGMPGPANLSGSLDAILQRAADEGRRILEIRRAIPTDRMRFGLSDRALTGGPITIKPEHWRVLLSVDGARDVNKLADTTGSGRLGVLRQLYELIEAGLIDALEPAPEPVAPPPPPLVMQPAPAPRQTPVVESPRSFEAPPVQAPAPPPPPPQEFWQAPTAPTPPPRMIEQPTDDLSALLQARLSALEPPPAAQPAPKPAAPHSPQDFWQAQASSPTPPAPQPVVERPVGDTDDRLAALFGRSTTIDPTSLEPAVSPPQEERAPAEPLAPAGGPQADAPISHWLPPDTTAPILEAEVPPPAKEEKRRGLFGFGRKRPEDEQLAPSYAPSALPESSPGQLASFANALITEYNSGQYGKARLDERMNVRLRIVDEQADPMDRMLPVQDDRLDVGAIDRDFAPQQAGPYLATLVRQIFEDAERVFGKDKAKKGYKAAVKNALGGDESVLRDRVIAPNLPRV